MSVGVAVKDRRRVPRATTTGRELVLAGNRRRRKRERLIGILSGLQPAQMVLPLLESLFLERPPPGTQPVPDVTEGVAQDRKRQESQADFIVEE